MGSSDDVAGPELLMFVKMLTAMAGAAFSYAPGSVVEVKDTIGKAWVAAGLAEIAAEPGDKAPASAKRVKEAEAATAAAVARAEVAEAKVTELEPQVAALEAQVAELAAKVAELQAPPAA
jgi:hypothetical protein